MARRFKNLIKVESGYTHREHRSKRGRQSIPRIQKVRAYKRRLEELKIKSLYE